MFTVVFFADANVLFQHSLREKKNFNAIPALVPAVENCILSASLVSVNI